MAREVHGISRAASTSNTPTPTVASVKFQVDHDSVTVDYPNAKVEIYEARIGGTGGTVVETIQVIYTDATKQYVLSAARF